MHMADERKQPLAIPPSAAAIQEQITEIFRAMKGMACGEPRFVRAYRRAMRLYDSYQREVIAASGLSIMCHTGCYICCCHWPDDVYSFEAEMIANAVRRMSRRRRLLMEESCRDSVAEYERITALSKEKLANDEYRSLGDEVDFAEIVLTGFYQLKSRCPFLDDDDRCAVYELRPLTCRAYVNLGDPTVCPPEMILENDESTFILDLDDESNAILDELSERCARFPGDTGLRSLVLKYLEER